MIMLLPPQIKRANRDNSPLTLLLNLKKTCSNERETFKYCHPTHDRPFPLLLTPHRYNAGYSVDR